VSTPRVVLQTVPATRGVFREVAGRSPEVRREAPKAHVFGAQVVPFWRHMPHLGVFLRFFVFFWLSWSLFGPFYANFGSKLALHGSLLVAPECP